MSLGKLLAVVGVAGAAAFVVTHVHAKANGTDPILPASSGAGPDPNTSFVTGKKYRFTLQYMDSTTPQNLNNLLSGLGFLLDVPSVLLNGQGRTLLDPPSAASDVWTVNAQYVGPGMPFTLGNDFRLGQVALVS